MSTTRRTFTKGAMAVAAAAAAPAIGRAQGAPPAARTIRAVMHGDLRVFDPIWTTANITSYHAHMVYDTLFGVDDQYRPQPQMVGKHGLSDDRKTYTFELRDGLKFSDGTSVTARDCVASIRRWAARDGAAQHMFMRVADTPVKDDRTFQIVLKEPYGLVIDNLAKTGTNVLFVMREKEAQTDPMQQISTIVGSGPFLFNEGAMVQGQRYVYDKNPNYVPRSEPASFTAGGKVVKIDRAIYENIADEATAIAAIKAGEIDFIEYPNVDLLSQLDGEPGITQEILNKPGQMGWCRLNFLHPPFNNIYARQAMRHIIHPTDVMKATFGDPKYFRGCGALFGCGNPMENDANTEWFKEGQNFAKARELIKKSGYDGRPVVVLQATNIAYMNNAATLISQWMKEAGFNVSTQASDWGGVVTRRAVKAPPDQGGWNVFFTSASSYAYGSPIGLVGHAATGEKGWFGWPSNEKHEILRDKWAAAATEDERKAIAREIQENAWDFVPHLYFGAWVQPSALRNLKGMIGMPEVIPLWNVEKTA
ncbi:MAG: ABC transporter substrate-binding protein [Rhizobiales bacterium]|nr:ABC transporter substrate-binding protein [Hyphomicrobiales bacterium]